MNTNYGFVSLVVTGPETPGLRPMTLKWEKPGAVRVYAAWVDIVGEQSGKLESFVVHDGE